MIYLLLGIVTNAMVSIVMRISENYVKGRTSVLAMNYLTCFAVALACAQLGGIREESVALTVGMGLFNGFLFLSAFLLLQRNIRRNGVVLASIFMKLGILVPILVAIVLFGESPTAVQLLGFGVAVGAIILISSGPEKVSASDRSSLLLLLLAVGGAQGMSKIFEGVGSRNQSGLFLACTFGMAFALCISLVLWKKDPLGIAEVFFGALIGIPNYFCTSLILQALTQLDAVIVYPTYSVGALLTVTLAGVLLFRERLGRRQWAAVAAILAALVLLNL